MIFKQVTNITIPEGSVVKITDPNGLVLWQKQSAFDNLCFTALANGSFGMSHYGTNKTTTIPKLQYSRDGVNWTDWLFESISVVAGDKVYFKGNNPNGISRSTSNYSTFTATGRFEASGNIMSILGVNEINTYSFCRLFSKNKMITVAPELPATTMASSCYQQMFSGCTALTIAPVLPATTLATYCYQQMFEDCTALTTAPELPVTTMAVRCYYSMFNGCTKLTTAPVLPATTLAQYCYAYMFSGCTKLTTVPELSATTLQPYCYIYMFNGCTKLNNVKHSIVNWNTSYTSNWLYGVATSGVMRCPTNSTIPSNNVSGIPSGWSRVNF